MGSAVTWLVGVMLAGTPQLDAAKKSWQALDYPSAEVKLRAALEGSELSPDERREAVDLLVRTLVALNRGEQAETVYLRQLSVDPGTPAPADASPRIRDAYLRAKGRLYPKDFLKLEATASPGTLEVTLADPWQRARALRLGWRDDGGQPLATTTLPPAQQQKLAWRSGAVRAELEALDDKQRVLATTHAQGVSELGTPSGAPLVSATPPPETPPWLPVAPEPRAETHVRWPTYTLASAGVAAVAAGIACAVLSAQDTQAARRAPSARQTTALDDAAAGKAIAAQALFGGALVFGAGAGLTAWRYW